MESSLPPWRTFSIFISSTFADMQGERDHLKNVVFPRVEEELQQHRIKLEIVDLRWGVDTTSIAQEDEREASVLKVCLDEIRRCRPFFIGLLGDRYGWVPPAERMKAALVGEEHISSEKGKSVTDLEIEFGVLASREQLVRSVFYFRDPLPYETLGEKKAALFSDQYNKKLSNVEKKERKDALDNLKARIRNHFENHNQKEKVQTYSGIWDSSNEKVTGLKEWGDKVYKDILDECEKHAKDTWDQVPQNWQEQELALLDAFIESHTHVTTITTDGKEEEIPTFCGRKPLIDELKKHLLSDDVSNWGLVLTGESGSGKSAVFSMIVKEMQKEDCFILAHSAGLSPRTKNVADLLQIWNNLLRQQLGMEQEIAMGEKEENLKHGLTVEQEKAPATPIEKLQKKFLELLQLTSAKNRVVLLIDALDRFEPTARAQHMSWLPGMMPKNVRLLLTAIIGTEQKAVKYNKGLNVKSIDRFSAEEAKEMLHALCRQQHKNLPEKIEKIILEKERSDGQLAIVSPLWLSLAVNMLMAIDHDDFEKMNKMEGRGDQQIENYLTNLANEFDPLPGPLFLSLVAKAGVLFGVTFTQALFDFIAVSRNGLREKDLEKLLPARNIDWDSLQFAGLRRWFRAHLILQGEELQWNLAHSILKNTFAEKISFAEKKIIHDIIGKYLMNLPGNDSLQITETMYHLMQIADLDLAASWYGRFWWDDIHTEGSSKAIAEAVIIDESLGKSDWMEWLVSLHKFDDNEKLDPRTISINFISSLFEKHFQNDITIQTQIRLVQSAEKRMEEICRRAPDSADYERDLTISYDRLGDLYVQLGDPPKALDKYQASLTIREELCRRAPDSTEYARDLSVVYNKLGKMYLRLGDIPKALDKYQASLTIAEELRRRAPDSADCARDLTAVYNNFGDIYLQLGDLPKALDKYQASLTIREELCRRAPDSTEYAGDLSDVYVKLGNMYLNLGDLPKALDKYQASLTIAEELRRRAPDSADCAQDLMVSYEKIGSFSTQIGNIDKAKENIQKAFDLSFELHQRAPDSAQYSFDLSRYYSMLGDLYLQLGEPPKALDKYEASLTIAEELRRRAPDSADYAQNLSISYTKMGDLYVMLGNPPQALDKYQASLTIAEELHHRAPDSAEYAFDLSISFDNLGDMYLDLGDPPKALDKYEASLTIREELCHRAPDSAGSAHCLMVSYVKLGDLYFQVGDPPKALDKYQASLTIAEELHRRAPDSAEYARDLMISYERIGSFSTQIGNIDKAKENIQKAFDLSLELHQRAPDSAQYSRSLSRYCSMLGNLYLQLGDPPKALDKYQASLTIREELRHRAPDSADYARDLSIVYTNLGDMYLNLGDPPKALDKYQASLTIAEEFRRRAPDSANYARDLSIVYTRLGDLYLQLGDSPKALDKYQASLTIAEELRRRAPDLALYNTDLLCIYQRLIKIYCRRFNIKKMLKFYILSIKTSQHMIKKGLFIDLPLMDFINKINFPSSMKKSSKS